MAGFNPFAPQGPKAAGVPKVQGHQAPNVQMQSKPGLAQTLGPSVFNKAMGSETASEMGTAMGESTKNAFSSLLAAPTAATPAVSAAQAAGMAGSAASTGGALGPFGIPVLVGAGLLAANSGK